MERLTTFIFALAATVAVAADDPAELMRRSEKAHTLPFEHTRARMVLQEKDGEPKERVLENWVDDRPSGYRFRVRFTAPADVAGTGVLSLEKKGDDDEQWLYLPAFKKTRRLGSAELGDRFVGTDFFYEDMKNRNVDDYTYTMLPAETLEGQECWVIEGKPSAPKIVKESPYGKTVAWMRKDNLAIVRVRYFDKKDQPLKQLDATKLKQITKSAWRPEETTMVDVRRKHRTTMTLLLRETADLADDQFSRRALESE